MDLRKFYPALMGFFCERAPPNAIAVAHRGKNAALKRYFFQFRIVAGMKLVREISIVGHRVAVLITRIQVVGEIYEVTRRDCALEATEAPSSWTFGSRGGQ